MTRVVRSSVLLALAAALLTGCSHAADLKIGQPAPRFAALEGVDGKKHALDDFKKAELVVVVFTCNHCPVAQAYEDRLIALQKEYAAKGVQVVAINVNTIPDDRLDKMKERAEQKGFNFPYLFDPTQKVGQDFGALVTPHVFVLDKNRAIAYLGAVDDNMIAEKMKTPYLRHALDALLAGQKVPEPSTKAFGCSIKYE
jgi:peroxiredoxin